MRQMTEAVRRDLPLVIGARRLLATGRLGAELVRLAEASAQLERERGVRLAEAGASAAGRGMALGARR